PFGIVSHIGRREDLVGDDEVPGTPELIQPPPGNGLVLFRHGHTPTVRTLITSPRQPTPTQRSFSALPGIGRRPRSARLCGPPLPRGKKHGTVPVAPDC